MAMDALKNLTNNIPAWQRRLEELSGQIDKRQVELAALVDPKSRDAEVRTLRNKGSTESLKPSNDGPMHISVDGAVFNVAVHEAIDRGSPLKPTSPTVREAFPSPRKPTLRPTSTPISTPSPQQAVRPRQLKTTRKRTASVASVDSPKSPTLTRNMIIVYYDSYVQGFFDDMVRFISSSRNLMRKAKMAAKVAQIKRLAELDTPDDESTSGDDRTMIETLPSLRLINSRRYGASGVMRFGAPGIRNASPDVYDELDKALESVQSTCEHGAHQFLRDANCSDELRKIQKRMLEVLDVAQKEAERVTREEPELAKETGDLHKPRTRRPITMSRNLISASQKDAGDDLSSAAMDVADAVRRSPLLRTVDNIEVDTLTNSDDVEPTWPPTSHYRGATSEA